MHQLDDIIKMLNEHSGAGSNLPPVEQWQPKNKGSIDIHIDAQGHWYHEGDIFKRQKLVNLFASILRYESGQYFLVTPAEQLSIKVDDVAFLAELLVSVHENPSEPSLQLVTQCGDIIALNSDSQWELRRFQGEMIPYVLVRHQLWARVARHVFYQLVDIAINQQSDDDDSPVKSSDDNAMLSFISENTMFLLGHY